MGTKPDGETRKVLNLIVVEPPLPQGFQRSMEAGNDMNMVVSFEADGQTRCLQRNNAATPHHHTSDSHPCFLSDTISETPQPHTDTLLTWRNLTCCTFNCFKCFDVNKVCFMFPGQRYLPVCCDSDFCIKKKKKKNQSLGLFCLLENKLQLKHLPDNR